MSRPDVQNAMGITEILPDAIRVNIQKAPSFGGLSMNSNSGSKEFKLPEHGKCVIYTKDGTEKMTSVKPLYLFDRECQLGPPLILRSELMKKLDPTGT
eukprot:6247052-Prymnesium_polylepis.1